MPRTLPLAAIFHIRRRSLLRGNLVVLGSFVVSFALSGFPNSHRNLLLILPAILAPVGMIDTVRCMQTRWGFYQGGVFLLLLMDMMALCLIYFFLVFPYLF